MPVFDERRRPDLTCVAERDAAEGFARPRREWCQAEDHGWACTRRKDHKGPHVSSTDIQVFDRWGWVR